VEFNSGKNLKLMPNRCNEKQLKYNEVCDSNVILKHETHPAYTRYVKNQLDLIDPYGQDREYQLWLLLGHLTQKLEFEGQIPFR
jgi:hypothetical protein